MMEKVVKAETPYGIKMVRLVFKDTMETAVNGIYRNSFMACNDVITRPGMDFLRMMGVEVRYADSY